MEDTWQKTGDNANCIHRNAIKLFPGSTDHLRVKNMTLGSLYLKVGL